MTAEHDDDRPIRNQRGRPRVYRTARECLTPQRHPVNRYRSHKSGRKLYSDTIRGINANRLVMGYVASRAYWTHILRY